MPDFQDDEVRERDIAVVGMAGRFPGGRDLDDFWRMLVDGREAVTTFSDEELRAAGVPDHVIAHPDYVKAGSVLDGVEEFDAGFFGYTAREAEILDPQQRLFLEHAWAAMEDAGHDPARYPGLVGIYAGVAWNTYLLSNLREHRELFEGSGGFQVFITNDKDFMPTRASYKLDLKGPSMIVQTSCSTSLVAIHMAALSLLNYECDMALAGGVTVKVPQVAGYHYQDGGLASPDGHCRAFDADAAGTIFGSGVGIVALKRLSEALEDGDTIRAVLRGSAINNDGAVKVSYTAPSVEGQAEVVATALAVAEAAPSTVGYVECHGTGTSLGDPIEVTALSKVFRELAAEEGDDLAATPRCALGSVKSNVGHLDAAAGVAGFIKTVLALEHGRIPPTVNFSRPNPRLDLESSPFRVADALADWPVVNGTPRRAGVSSFGVGGTNAHAILEEAPAPAAPAPSRPWQLLPLSARSPEAVEAATANLGRTLAEGVPAGGSLADVAFTLSEGRRAFAHRRFLVAADAEDAAARLADADAPLPLGRAAGSGDEVTPRPVAFLLPGQGAQHPDMARRLYEDEAVFREALDEALGHYRGEEGGGGDDLRRWLFPAAGTDPDEAAERLRDTALAQPALFAVEYALARLWMAWGVEPVAMLGHSLGELVAACLAGVFSLADGMALVTTRGRLMAAAPEGSMLAVPLPAAEVEEKLAAAREDAPEDAAWAGRVELAAVNQPDRVTVSGPDEAITAFAEALAADGVQARPLHTSHAFHSASMEGAVEPFRAAVAGVELAPPSIPFVSNLSGTWITDAEATDPGYWARHLRGTVRFADGLAVLLEEGDEGGLGEPALLEVGPGDTLSTLARRHAGRDRRPVVSCLPHPRQAGDGRRGDSRVTVLEALGRLWMAGAEVDWESYWAGETRRRLPLPTYPFQRRRYWIDAGPAAGSRPGVTTALAGAEADAMGGADTPAGKRPDVASWLYRAGWREAPLAADADAFLAACSAAGEGADDGGADDEDARDRSGEEGSGADGKTADGNTADVGAAAGPRPWWLVTAGAGGDHVGADHPAAALAAALESRLAAAGVPVTRAVASEGASALERRGEGVVALDPGSADQWAALAAEAGGAPRAVLHLAGLTEKERPDDAPLLDDALLDDAADVSAAAAGFRGLAALVEGARRGAGDAPLDLTLVAPGLFRVTAMERLRPAAAVALGAVRVLPEEAAGVSARAVDPGEPGSTSAHRLADRLLAEVAAAGGDSTSGTASVEVALRGGQRWIRHYLPAVAAPGPSADTASANTTVPADGVWLLSGRLSADALAPARHLAGRGARLALLTSEDEAATATRAAEELAALGAEVGTFTADPLDADSVAGALAAARDRFGDLDGVLHSVAGGDVHLLSDLAGPDLATAPGDAHPVAAHLRTVAALETLHRALVAGGHRPATALVASSLASLLGGLANGAATAAALAAGAWAEERSRRREAEGAGGEGDAGPAWLALDLDPWAADGQAAAGAPSPANPDAYAVTADEIGPLLERALAADRGAGGRLLVSTGSLGRRLADRRQRLAAHGGGATAPSERHPRPDLDVPFTPPESDLERRIAEVWSELLGFDRIGLDDNFFELGGDSFVAVRVASRLKDVLGTELPVAQLYEALTVRALARLVEETAGRQDEREAHLEERRQAKDRRSDRLARRRERIGASR